MAEITLRRTAYVDVATMRYGCVSVDQHAQQLYRQYASSLVKLDKARTKVKKAVKDDYKANVSVAADRAQSAAKAKGTKVLHACVKELATQRK